MDWFLSPFVDRDSLSISRIRGYSALLSQFRHKSTFTVRTMNVRPYVSLFACVLEFERLQKRDTVIAANRAVAKHRYAKSVSSIIRYSVYRLGKVIRLGKYAYMVWLLFMRDLTSQMAVEELIISNEIFVRFEFNISIRVNVHAKFKWWYLFPPELNFILYLNIWTCYFMNYASKKYFKTIGNIYRCLFLFYLLD